MDAARGDPDSLPDYARDLKLNLGIGADAAGRAGPQREADLVDRRSPSAIASRNTELARRSRREATARLQPTWRSKAAQAAAAIMGMNNIYYRFLHLVEDEEYQACPRGCA